jgi:hypothetical protein
MAGRRAFNTRALISLLVASGFLVMAVTGIMLYVSPPGRVANWTDWTLLWLTKDQWAAVHISSSLVFVLAGLTHLVMNRKPFFNYLHTRFHGHEMPRLEGVVAVLAVVALVWGTLANVPPISWLLDLNERAKLMWSTEIDAEPPFGHAEEVSLAMLGTRDRFAAEAAVTALEAAGLVVAEGTATTLRQIADDNGRSPGEIYPIIRAVRSAAPAVDPAGRWTPTAVEARFAGGGIGRLTVAQLAAEADLAIADVEARLTELGLPTLDGGNGAAGRLKAMADAAGLEPLELAKALLIEGYAPAGMGGD